MDTVIAIALVAIAAGYLVFRAARAVKSASEIASSKRGGTGCGVGAGCANCPFAEGGKGGPPGGCAGSRSVGASSDAVQRSRGKERVS